jgi:bud site selection protein 31
MSWRLRQKLRKAPEGWEQLVGKLDEFETRMREATAEPRGERLNHELAWPVHKLHFEKNRYLHDLRYIEGSLSEELLRFLVKEKIADGPLIAKWRKPGYETVCSLAVITRSNTNFGTVGICRTTLKDRVGQIMPNILTGCVCCASGCNGPIWWDDPIPDIVRDRILEADPGKADLLDEPEEDRVEQIQQPGSQSDAPPTAIEENTGAREGSQDIAVARLAEHDATCSRRESLSMTGEMPVDTLELPRKKARVDNSA